MSKNKYDIDKYRLRDLEGVRLPQFQRGISWKKAAIENFVATLKRGHPFGSILLYKKGEKLTLIDGLQRYNSIRSYQRDPMLYLKKDIHSIVENQVRKFVEENSKQLGTNPQYQLEIVTLIELEIKKIYSVDFNGKTTYSKIAEVVKNLHEKQGTLRNVQNLADEIAAIIETIDSKIDISGIIIPVIIFEGEESELAEIFESLNRGGVSLSKYQVFAAAWEDKKLIVPENEMGNNIIENIILFYNNMKKDTNLEVDNFEEETFRERREINLFEYCKALQMMVEGEMQVLKNQKKQPTESLVFSILTSILGNPNTKMEKISAIENISKENTLFITELAKKVLIAVKDVNSIFESVFCINTLNGEKTEYVSTFVYSELQFASIIISYFNICFEIKKDLGLVCVKEGSAKGKEQFKKHVIGHYVYDQFSGAWKGSGDSKLNKVVAENSYMESKNKDDLEFLFGNWKEDHAVFKNKKPNALTKMLVALFYNTNRNSDSSEVEFSVIISEKREENIRGNSKIKSTGRLGNQIIFIKDKNFDKWFTFYENMDNNKGLAYLEGKQEFYSYPLENELDFLNSQDEKSGEKYDLFLKRREDYLLDNILKKL